MHTSVLAAASIRSSSSSTRHPTHIHTQQHCPASIIISTRRGLRGFCVRKAFCSRALAMIYRLWGRINCTDIILRPGECKSHHRATLAAAITAYLPIKRAPVVCVCECIPCGSIDLIHASLREISVIFVDMYHFNWATLSHRRHTFFCGRVEQKVIHTILCAFYQCGSF